MMYVYYVCTNSTIIALTFLFSIHYSPSNECLPDDSSHQESFTEVQDKIED